MTNTEPKKMFRIERIVTAVQYTHIDAVSAEDAREEAIHNPHLWDWSTSSENDPQITGVQEVS